MPQTVNVINGFECSVCRTVCPTPKAADNHCPETDAEDLYPEVYGDE